MYPFGQCANCDLLIRAIGPYGMRVVSLSASWRHDNQDGPPFRLSRTARAHSVSRSRDNGSSGSSPIMNVA